MIYYPNCIETTTQRKQRLQEKKSEALTEKQIKALEAFQRKRNKKDHTIFIYKLLSLSVTLLLKIFKTNLRPVLFYTVCPRIDLKEKLISYF